MQEQKPTPKKPDLRKQEIISRLLKKAELDFKCCGSSGKCNKGR